MSVEAFRRNTKPWLRASVYMRFTGLRVPGLGWTGRHGTLKSPPPPPANYSAVLKAPCQPKESGHGGPSCLGVVELLRA